MFHRKRSLLTDPTRIGEIINRNVALARLLDIDEATRLVAVTEELIATKRWEPIAGLDLTDEVLVTIAANAAIPVLALDTRLYGKVRSIILRPGSHRSSGVRSGPVRGLVSDSDLSVIGEATPNAGPMSLSWRDALAESRRPASGRNVVIHEFAHKIDTSDGYSDGTPPLAAGAAQRWGEILADELERPTARESDAVLRPYAWTNRAEFFAVATEAFFCTPVALQDAKPDLYAALGDFYLQDPASRARAAETPATT